MSQAPRFVERLDNGFYVAGSRVPLASVVREFLNGHSPEAIRSAFPAGRKSTEDAFSESHPPPSAMKEKLDRARRQLGSS
jgi:hypothetical protein